MELFYLQLTILALLLTVGVFFTCNFSFFTYSWSFFAYSGKVRLISALRDNKQRSSTVSNKARAVSEKASPLIGGGHMAGNRRKLQEGFRAQDRAQESRALANFHKKMPNDPRTRADRALVKGSFTTEADIGALRNTSFL